MFHTAEEAASIRATLDALAEGASGSPDGLPGLLDLRVTVRATNDAPPCEFVSARAQCAIALPRRHFRCEEAAL